MHRLTISIPEELAASLAREARRRDVSVSAVAREALGSHLHLVVSTEGRRKLPFAAIGSSGESDVASNVESILAEEWNPDRDR
jgi:hypothetical protein